MKFPPFLSWHILCLSQCPIPEARLCCGEKVAAVLHLCGPTFRGRRVLVQRRVKIIGDLVKVSLTNYNMRLSIHWKRTTSYFQQLNIGLCHFELVNQKVIQLCSTKVWVGTDGVKEGLWLLISLLCDILIIFLIISQFTIAWILDNHTFLSFMHLLHILFQKFGQGLVNGPIRLVYDYILELQDILKKWSSFAFHIFILLEVRMNWQFNWWKWMSACLN